MLANVLDIDHDSMRISLKTRTGTLILFDFKAAFPSVAHAYLWAALRAVGLPSNWIQALQRLYVNNYHTIKFRGQTFSGFVAGCGVRQGCPVSPLLFAIVVDLLLRRISQELPGVLVRAFADDTAVILQDFFKQANKIEFIFSTFARMSNLKLNIPKTVLIPLWCDNGNLAATAATFQERVYATLPWWTGVAVKFSARYLGFLVGPTSHSGGYTDAIRKFNERIDGWSSLHLGLMWDCRVYKVFVFSVLSFLPQLTNIPVEAYQAEARALKRFAAGPNNWCSPEDLFQLKEFGFNFNFPSLANLNIACKLRIFEFEQAGFDFIKSHSEIRSLRFSVEADLPLVHIFDDWYNNNMAKVVLEACASARKRGIDGKIIKDHIINENPGAPRHKHAILIKRKFQGQASLLLRAKPGFAEERIRIKLVRWKLEESPRAVAARALTRLHIAFKLVAPRVAAVFFLLCGTGGPLPPDFRNAIPSAFFAAMAKTALSTTRSVKSFVCVPSPNSTFLLST